MLGIGKFGTLYILKYKVMIESIKYVIKEGLLKINPIKTIAALGVIGMTSFMCYALVYVKIPQENREPLLMLLGMISGGLGAIIGYYYGSSAGSKNKDDIIKQMNSK